jgi:hypothetical protein
VLSYHVSIRLSSALWFPCYDLRIKTMFGLSLPPVVFSLFLRIVVSEQHGPNNKISSMSCTYIFAKRLLYIRGIQINIIWPILLQKSQHLVLHVYDTYLPIQTTWWRLFQKRVEVADKLLSHNVVSSTPRLSGIRTYNVPMHSNDEDGWIMHISDHFVFPDFV